MAFIDGGVYKMKYGISLAFQQISTILVSKFKLHSALLKIKEILKIKPKAFVLLLIKHQAFFGTQHSLQVFNDQGLARRRNIATKIF